MGGAAQVPSEQKASHNDMEMKDFASALAHNMACNDFDKLTSKDRVLVNDSGREDVQSMMLSLGGVAEFGRITREDTGFSIDMHGLRSRRGRRVDSSSNKREREIAKHGELEHTQGKEKDRFTALGKRKRKRCSIPNCAKKSRWQCTVCEAALCRGGDHMSCHQSKVREDMKENEQEAGC
jgi:hypothetical protein